MRVSGESRDIVTRRGEVWDMQADPNRSGVKSISRLQFPVILQDDESRDGGDPSSRMARYHTPGTQGMIAATFENGREWDKSS